MLELVKSNETENKPKNVEEAIKAGWKTAKEMYEAADVGERTWRRFLADVSNAMSEKSNFSYAIDGITEKCITGPHNIKYYHPKVEEAFQLWLRRNAINAGGQRTEGSIIKQEIHDIVDNSEYKYTKEEICSICNCSVRTFENFAPKSVSEQDFISVGSNHKKLYTEQVLQQFQLWLRRNAINAGGQRTEGSIIKQEIHDIVDNSEYKYTKEEICSICNVDEKTFRRFFEEVRLDIDVQSGITTLAHNKKMYTEQVLQQFQAWLMKNQANQGKSSEVVKQATSQAVEKDLVITEVIKSGNQEAFNQLMNQYKLAFDTAQENKRLLEQNKQMEHALNYTAVIGWKKWSDLKKELAQSFEIFQHRISFKTVAAEAGLVKETDYAERIYGEDCFPTTMISESGIDKIYNCYDR